MSLMQPHVYKKGALYCADCPKCGASQFAHEWVDADADVNQVNTPDSDGSTCTECGSKIPADQWSYVGKSYAGRYSADGYLDCTSWHFNANLRKLKTELHEYYGD